MLTLKLSSVIIYKDDPFKLSHIFLTKYLVSISVSAQVCLALCLGLFFRKLSY